MKHISIIVLAVTILLAIVPFFAESPHAQNTFTAASCSSTDVQAAINLATDGDTVLVPGPTNCATLGAAATWSSMPSVTKGITLNGQGAFIIMSSGTFTITADTVASAIVKNFNWNNGYLNGGCPINFVISKSPLTKPFRFTGNTYLDSTTSGPVTELCVGGVGPGLIDHNSFTGTNGADEIIHFNGVDSPTWNDDLTPGDLNMVYAEDNTCTNNSSTYVSPCEEAFNGAEFVFRHNTLNGMANDVHNGSNGARWSEIYENTYNFALISWPANFAQIRGGSGLYYNNHYGIASGSPTVSVGPDCPGSSDTCSGTWPVGNQVGRGINQTTYSPLYLWGNDTSIQNSIGASGSQSLVVVGTATTDAVNCSSHTGNTCDAVKTATQQSLVRCQTAADVGAGCPVTYTYVAAPYPYPF
jgi:hypothetical protein